MKYIFLLFAFCRAASADIVFFDFNDGPQEIEAVKRAARARGEKVHVFPTVSPDVSVRLRHLRGELRQVGQQYSRAATQAQRQQFERRFREIENQRMQLMGGARFDAARAKEALRSLSAKGIKVSTLVLSGHDGNNNFSGTFGGLHSNDLKEALKEMPELASNIKSLFLAGCYTATPGSLEYNFKDAMPNLRSVAGYPGSAPNNERGAGHQFLERFLKGEERLARAKTPNEVKAVAGSMIPGDVSTTAAICLPNKKYFKQGQYRDLEQEWKNCGPLFDKLAANRETLMCYMNARPGCEMPPAETQSGPLREYYTALQAAQPCRHNPEFAARAGELFDGETMIRLMYFKNVRKNFAEHYKNELEQSKDVLIKAGYPQELAGQVTKVKDLDRRETLDMIRKLEEFQNSQAQLEIGEDEKSVARLASMEIVQSLKDHLVQLSPNCVPFHWVEGASTATSTCGAQSNLGQKAIDHANDTIPIRRIDRKVGALERDLIRGDGRGSGDQDRVISDEAVAASVIRSERELYQARISALRRQQNVLYIERDLKRLGDSPRDQAVGTSLRQRLEQARQLAAEADARARALAEPTDLKALQENRAKFFERALRFAQSETPPERETIPDVERRLEDWRNRLSQTTGTQRAVLESDIKFMERNLANLKKREAERAEHVEYLQRMSRLLTAPNPDPADQARIAEMVVDRVRINAEERKNYLNSQIEMYSREIQQCTTAQSAGQYCHTSMNMLRNSLQQFTNELDQMQRRAEITSW